MERFAPSDHPVVDYLASLPESRRARITGLYAVARGVAPEATEGLKYGMPALVVAGKGVLAIMSTSKHIGLYPYSGNVVQAFAAELAALGIPTTKGAIQLPDDVDLPAGLLTRIVTMRLGEVGG
ncbi:MAG: DUF1801 domain-containing protein [Dermatophilaceae bacterium]